MATDHLEWTEIRDFSKGLWTRDSSYLMPADAFQAMTDCHPQPGGGVRAFWKEADDSGTGLPASGEKPIALAAQLQAISNAIYLAWVLVTRVTATGGLKAYYRPGGSSVWSLSKTFAAPAIASPGDSAQLLTYERSDGTRLWVLGHVSWPNGGALSADNGTWVFNGTTWTRISGVFPAGPFHAGPPLAVYQQRLFYTLANTIYWTDPGGTTFPTANYLELDLGFRDISSTPAALIAFSPSTLLVPTSGGTWISIEGDISDPVVREMGRNHNVGTGWPVAVDDDGVWFYEPNHGIWLAQNSGSTFTKMDNQLAPWDQNEADPLGLAIYDEYVFGPDGFVFDKTAGCWIKVSYLDNADVRGYWNALNQGLYTVQFKTAPAVTYIKTGSDGSRLPSYTVQTAPLRGADGRQVVIREVQIPYKSFDAASTITVTVGSTTLSSATLPVGTGIARFRFAERGEYLDVKVTAASNTANEAPMIEAIRIGRRRDGHYVQ